MTDEPCSRSKRLARGHLGVGVHEHDLTHEFAGLESEPGARADQTAAADNTYFHGTYPSLAISGYPTWP